MDMFENPIEVLSMVTVMVVLLLNTNRALSLSATEGSEDEILLDQDMMMMNMEIGSKGMDAMTCTTLMHYYLWNTLPFLNEELGFWVKLSSTTWFSRFFIHKYDDSRWMQLFG